MTINSATHVILMKDGSKKYLNKKAYDFMWRKIEEGASEILMGGNLISMASVAQLMSLDEYYTQYPKDRPAQLNEFKFETVVKNATTHRKALEGMIKGLKRYIASTPENPVNPNGCMPCWYQGTKAPLELLEKMEAKLEVK